MSLLQRQDTTGCLQRSVLQSLGYSAKKEGENQDDNNSFKQSLLMMTSFSQL